MKNEYKLFKARVKAVNTKEHTVEAVISDYSIDRDKERFVPGAWKKHLKYYKAHPVLVSSHSYRDLRKQIGEAPKIKETDEGLVATFRYYVDEGNPEADWAFFLASKGMAMFSVGFGTHEAEWQDIEKNDGKLRREITVAELVEVSQVIVGSNRNALQRSIDENGEYKEVAELILKGLSDEDENEDTFFDDPEKDNDTDNKKVKDKINEDDNIISLPFTIKVNGVEEGIEMLQMIKAGRVLSTKTRKLLTDAAVKMNDAMTAIKNLLDSVDKPEEPKGSKAAQETIAELKKIRDDLDKKEK